MNAKTIKTSLNNFWANNIATKPIVLSTTERSDTERKSILDKQIISYVSRGWRLDTQTDFAAVLSSGKRLNHILHLILSLVTFGIWIIFWIVMGLTNKIAIATVSVDEFGNTSIDRKSI
jgi:hypothetical protein